MDSIRRRGAGRECRRNHRGGPVACSHALIFLSQRHQIGLRVVLVAAKRLKPLGGKLAVYGMQPQVKEVFEISGFLRILEIAHSREDAIRRVA